MCSKLYTPRYKEIEGGNKKACETNVLSRAVIIFDPAS